MHRNALFAGTPTPRGRCHCNTTTNVIYQVSLTIQYNIILHYFGLFQATGTHTTADNVPCRYKALCHSARCPYEHPTGHWRTEAQKLQDSLVVDMHTAEYAHLLETLRSNVENYVLAQKLAQKLR